jgi:hypothetical protein
VAVGGRFLAIVLACPLPAALHVGRRTHIKDEANEKTECRTGIQHNN